MKKSDSQTRMRQLTIKAMFSDDDLMQILVLKGGNAIDLIHKVSERASTDIDLSMASNFADVTAVKDKLSRALQSTFMEEDYVVFDIRFEEVPQMVTDEMIDFWGGYKLEFKIVTKQLYKEYSDDIDALRRRAEIVTPDHGRKIRVDISKYEYCAEKESREIDGLTIYVYPPNAIVIEKLRAICQQMPEYLKLVKSESAGARAKDFFDIFTLMNHYEIDLMTEENRGVIRAIFEAKRVPLRLMGQINNYRAYHASDFKSVQDTVRRPERLLPFDVYFDYVVSIAMGLESLWKE